MPTVTRYDLRARYTVSQIDFSFYWTWQPHEFASEAVYATATQPTSFGGVAVGYRF